MEKNNYRIESGQNKKSNTKVGVRINKYLALKKISTRRGADELITNQKVFINGKRAVLGSKVLETDKVEVRGRKKKSMCILLIINL